MEKIKVPYDGWRGLEMARLIAVVLITVVIVVFAMANMHHIELSLVVGKPAQVRLIFLLGSAYLAGMVTSVLWGMARKLQRSRELRSLQLKSSDRLEELEE